MRYTTVIDISEIPPVYNCMSARLVYFHMALKAGWGERNQGFCRTSYRILMGDLGLTLSAVRHAILVLKKYKLVKDGSGGYWVRIFCPPTKAAGKPKTGDSAKLQRIAAEREAADLQREMEYQENKRKAAEGRNDPRVKEIMERMSRGQYGGPAAPGPAPAARRDRADGGDLAT